MVSAFRHHGMHCELLKALRQEEANGKANQRRHSG
jgi:hypothetical protein